MAALLLQHQQQQQSEMITSKDETDSKPPPLAPPLPPPEVPLPTYLWEEVRRSRLRGDYPWTHFWKPPFDDSLFEPPANRSREERLRARRVGNDHEYEPINPPEAPSPVQLQQQLVVGAAAIAAAADYDTPPVSSRPVTPIKPEARRFIKIPNEEAVIVPLHGDSDEELNPDRYENRELTVQEIQDSIEQKYFNQGSRQQPSHVVKFVDDDAFLIPVEENSELGINPDAYVTLETTEAGVELEEDSEQQSKRREIVIPGNPNAVIIPLHGDSDEEINPDRYEEAALVESPKREERTETQATSGGFGDQLSSQPRRFIRIPNEDAVIIPLHGDSDEELNPDRYADRELVKESGIDKEIIPLQQSQISVPKRTEDQSPQRNSQLQQQQHQQQQQEQSSSFQSRFKESAGHLRDKLRNISKPKISLPERPKIKLPDRPKIKLPDRPRMRLPERPQFLKEKPKFLTERPKFLSERPKFHLPDKSSFKLPERFTKRLEKTQRKDKVKVRKPNPSSLRRPLRDVVTISSQSQSGSHKNLFETLKSKTYPRFLSRKRRERAREEALRNQGTSLETESSLPSTPPHRKRPYSEQFVDIRYADDEKSYFQYEEDEENEEEEEGEEEGFEENSAPFHEPENQPMKAKLDTSSDPMDSDKEQHSSGSSRHRVGVLEEIDSDEFFLRQKGLSREDVQVSRYLSKEIRDAFRSPRNALAQMGDSTERYPPDDYDLDVREFEAIPMAPQRSKSVKSDKNEQFNTFPMRPSRRKHSEPDVKTQVQHMVKKPPRKFRSRSDMGQRSLRSLSGSEVFDHHDGLMDQSPIPPVRRKSTKSLNRSARQSATDIADIVQKQFIAQEQDIAPVAPFRKSRSRGTSLADDRTSRGADSNDLPNDDEEDDIEREVDENEREEEQSHPLPQVLISDADVVDEAPPQLTVGSTIASVTGGYASVTKSVKSPPPRPPPPPPPFRSRKEQIQSQLHTIKNQGVHFFFTYPRRAMKSFHYHKTAPPVRPARNYSTIGPSRPPRRNRVFREPVYAEGDSNEIEIEEVKKDDETESRDLQSGEILERMKGRPLPAPPRPPRRTKDDALDDADSGEMNFIDEENAENIVKAHDKFFVSAASPMQVIMSEMSQQTSFELIEPPPLIVTSEISQQTSFDITEVDECVQTDPLPEGFIVDDIPSEVDTLVASMQNEDIEEFLPPIPKRRIPSLQSANATVAPTLPAQSTFEPVSQAPCMQPVPIVFPDKLHLSELEVDKLNVNELQASKIKVSELESLTLSVSEITSNTGNITLNNIELPPDFIKNLLNQIQPALASSSAAPPLETSPVRSREPSPQPQLLRKVLTPPPPIIVQPAATSVSCDSPLALQASTTDHIPKPRTSKSTGRKSPTKIIDDSEDELAEIMEREQQAKKKRSHKTEKIDRVDGSSQTLEPPAPSLPPDQSATPFTTEETDASSALDLMRRLVVVLWNNLTSGAASFADGVNSMFPEGEKRRDAQVAAVMLVLLFLTLIIMGFGFDHSVHHHHWDYVPPR